jgi:hypothetical protein
MSEPRDHATGRWKLPSVYGVARGASLEGVLNTESGPGWV